ncbi:hypothetical protein [Vibrio phage vB_VpS_PG28]|nr:hypothetical protein [Vibrio phage vB_VpS_PG28]
MSYQPTDLAVFLPQVVSDSPTNGGVTTREVVASGVMNGIFPDVTSDERANGSTKYRKMIFKPNVRTISPLYECYLVCTKFSNRDVAMGFAYGTEDDTQATAASKQYYVMAKVVAKNGSGVLLDSSCQPLIENGTQTYRVFSQATQTTFTVRSTGWALTSGRVQITLSQEDRDKISLNDTLCADKMFNLSSLDTPTALTPQVHSYTKNSANGTVVEDMITYPAGALRSTVTLTFTSSETYNAVIDAAGTTKSGNINSTTTLYHPDGISQTANDIMLEIPPSVFSGTWAAGDTLQVTVESGAVPVWLKRIIPAGTSDTSGALEIGASLLFITS